MVLAIINKFRILGFLFNHPLNVKRKARALIRFLLWQIGSRMVPGAVAVNFVNRCRLLVKPGMTGATGNVYAGLHEFEDMAFVLHLLKKEDVFVDVGANIGSYTMLAGGAVGARCVSIEPIPSTFAHLMDNINLNGLGDRVSALNIGLGEGNGTLCFTSGFDTINHVVAETDVNTATITVPVKILDDVMLNIEPLLIKIDVEGFETNVIKGASKVLSNPTLLAVLMELNGSGQRYGFDESELHHVMLGYGFKTYRYLPFERALISLDGKNYESGNTLYLREIDEIRNRVTSSDEFYICNAKISL
jgi:FkbM family methyltransferase